MFHVTRAFAHGSRVGAAAAAFHASKLWAAAAAGAVACAGAAAAQQGEAADAPVSASSAAAKATLRLALSVAAHQAGVPLLGGLPVCEEVPTDTGRQRVAHLG